ncbi:hypothetical protein VCR3J2_80525 [Vibrio coralliirubri]|nr:hypothetical protein VCR1J2_200459 [Vibrio coralliirubri]CDU05236.1 hypothetical protein VCR3J2_80525 [Vibrio coralliirubri]CDU11950.1 hypothetical protein VCR17J2_350114 [Vibrio coralliirubri]
MGQLVTAIGALRLMAKIIEQSIFVKNTSINK